MNLTITSAVSINLEQMEEPLPKLTRHSIGSKPLWAMHLPGVVIWMHHDQLGELLNIVSDAIMTAAAKGEPTFAPTHTSKVSA